MYPSRVILKREEQTVGNATAKQSKENDALARGRAALLATAVRNFADDRQRPSHGAQCQTNELGTAPIKNRNLDYRELLSCLRPIARDDTLQLAPDKA